MTPETILIAPSETPTYTVAGLDTAPVLLSESQAISMFIGAGLSDAIRVPMVSTGIQVWQSGVFAEGVFT